MKQTVHKTISSVITVILFLLSLYFFLDMSRSRILYDPGEALWNEGLFVTHLDYNYNICDYYDIIFRSSFNNGRFGFKDEVLRIPSRETIYGDFENYDQCFSEFGIKQHSYYRNYIDRVNFRDPVIFEENNLIYLSENGQEDIYRYRVDLRDTSDKHDLPSEYNLHSWATKGQGYLEYTIEKDTVINGRQYYRFLYTPDYYVVGFVSNYGENYEFYVDGDFYLIGEKLSDQYHASVVWGYKYTKENIDALKLIIPFDISFILGKKPVALAKSVLKRFISSLFYFFWIFTIASIPIYLRIRKKSYSQFKKWAILVGSIFVMLLCVEIQIFQLERMNLMMTLRNVVTTVAVASFFICYIISRILPFIEKIKQKH